MKSPQTRIAPLIALLLAIFVIGCPDGQSGADDGAAKTDNVRDHSCGAGNVAECHRLASEAVVSSAEEKSKEDETEGSSGSVSELREACDGGVAHGCFALARLAAAGVGEGDPSNLLERACDGGAGAACHRLATSGLEDATAESAEEIVAKLVESCETGVAAACDDAAELRAGMSEKGAKAGETHRLWRIGCELGHARSCSRAGTMVVEGEAGEGASMEVALRMLGIACGAGHPSACHQKGLVLARGQGVKADRGAATRLFERACERGVADSCADLGVSYERGAGVAKDPKKAASLYEEACQSGSAQGCLNLGKAHINGRGVAKDPVLAAKAFGMACDRGRFEACTALAGLHEEGKGVSKNPTRALQLNQRACRGGFLRGCTNVGTALMRSEEPPQAKQGRKMVSDACKRGDSFGCLSLADHLASSGSDDKRIESLLKRACSLGQKQACSRLGKDSEGGDTAGIAAVMRAHDEAFQPCADLAKKAESGQITLRWRVGSDGAVKDVSLPNPDSASAKLATCLAKALSAETFPELAGLDVALEHTFRFD